MVWKWQEINLIKSKISQLYKLKIKLNYSTLPRRGMWLQITLAMDVQVVISTWLCYPKVALPIILM